ncbi:MAG: glycosyltransferase family 2 protein [Spirochaetales bacterium]|jgi:dolichol-phosphate mannosyltransferase|nr:glycosyltransferase family 2 protein [Spirochaetales bacterium]
MKSSKQPLFSFVIPVWNEEKNIPLVYDKLIEILPQINADAEFIFINDGSTDNSLAELDKLANYDKRVRYINFSRNFGHQAALTAGLQYSQGDAVVTLDCDLQDPPEVIVEMAKLWKNENYEIVYARRRNRHDNFFKKYTAILYYKLLEKFSDVRIPRNVGDFRLMDKKVVNIINKMPEKARYLRGMVAWVGYRYTFVDFDRPERLHGKTGYTLNKMVKLAMDGLFNFSLLPLRAGLVMGVLSIFLGIGFIIYMLVDIGINNVVYPLYKFLTVILFIFMGFSFITTWLLGEYIGRIYEEIKQRPLYIIQDMTNFEQTKK